MKYIQSFCKSMGESGCYFLCLCKLGEKETNKSVDYLRIAEICINKGYVNFNEKNYNDIDNFFVSNPCGVLEVITGQKWNVRKESGIYDTKENELEIWFWATSQKNADKGIGHFTTVDDNLLQNSVTVKIGKVYSKRIFSKR